MLSLVLTSLLGFHFINCQTITHELPRVNPFKAPQYQQSHYQHQPHHGYHGYMSPLRPGYHWPHPAPQSPHPNHPHHPIPQSPDVTKYVSTIKYSEPKVNNAPFSLEESTNLEENIERPTRQKETERVNTTSSDAPIDDSSEGVNKSEQELPDETFNFGYAVKDDKHGDDFSHQVANDGATTNGEYRVALPDGRVQV